MRKVLHLICNGQGVVRWGLPLVVAISTAIGFAAQGCGSDDSLFGGDAGDGGDLFGFDGAFNSDGGGGCVGLQCKQVVCPGGQTTSLTGIVHTPRPGDPDPLYNAIVYVPNAPVQPFNPGVTCDQCGAPASGSPIVVTLTGPDGKFKLDNVPVVNALPLVIQLGRWRRQVTITTVTACQTTAVDDELTRLPRNQTEGDIPLMALAMGDSDQPECVLRKMGIDDSEFTLPDLPDGGGGHGRIHVYQQTGVGSPPTLGPGTPTADQLWGSLDTLKKYDMLLIPCQGNETPEPDGGAMANVVSYADQGGRILGSHYTYDWMRFNTAWSSVASWHNDTILSGTRPGLINTSFAKGQAMADWLNATGATPEAGVIDALLQPRQDISSVPSTTLTWITMTQADRTTPIEPAHISFNTPLDAGDDQKCGRVVFNDFHVVDIFGGSTGVFPAECGDKTQPLTAQERVLEFMLFDLASCVQNDSQPPPSPR